MGTNELMITIGLLFAFAFDYQFTDVNGGWRIMFGFPAILSVLWAMLMFRMPESPKWLLLQGREDEAFTVFRMRNQEEAEAHEDMRKAQSELRHSQVQGPALSVLNKYKLSCLVAVALMILQNFSGHASILAYSPEVFQQAGFGKKSAGVATILLGVVKV